MADRFRPLTSVSARWCQLNGNGLEQLTLERHDDRISATGVIVADDGPGTWYQMFYDSNWSIKAAAVYLTDSRWFIVRSPTPGNWCDGDGNELNELAGCSDLIIRQSAFCFTPTVRRLFSDVCDKQNLRAAAVDLGELTATPAEWQISVESHARQFQFADRTRSTFISTIVDQDGLVVDAANAFKRIP